MTYSIEKKESWAGVELPGWIRFFDCRCDERDIPRAPWGHSLYGSERATVDLGLYTAEEKHATTLLSCSTYIDARTASDEEIARQLRDAIKEAEKLRKEYEEAKGLPQKPNEGGSCLYMPVAVTIANFGWSIVSDRRTCAVRGFGY